MVKTATNPLKIKFWKKIIISKNHKIYNLWWSQSQHHGWRTCNTKSVSSTQSGGEPFNKILRHAPVRGTHGLVGSIWTERWSAERAIEIPVIEPPIEAILMKHVAAIQLPYPFPISQRTQTYHTLLPPTADATFARILIREPTVYVQLLRQNDQPRHTRVDTVAVETGQPEGVEKAVQEGPGGGDAVGD